MAWNRKHLVLTSQIMFYMHNEEKPYTDPPVPKRNARTYKELPNTNLETLCDPKFIPHSNKQCKAFFGLRPIVFPEPVHEELCGTREEAWTMRFWK